MKPFASDMLSKRIPDITIGLMQNEFGVNISTAATIPIVFSKGWNAVLKYVKAQPGSEFSIDICGISLEYITEFSESDKPTNIVPQLIHKRIPVFTIKDEDQMVPGSKFNDELLIKYNSWRSVNLMETIDKIEVEVYSDILSEFGIDLMVPATVFPLMAATYVAGIQLAQQNKNEPINMYNVFEIMVTDGDQIILTPLSVVKQYVKGDSKK